MGSRCSSKVLHKGHRAFKQPTFKMMQLYLILMLTFSMLYLIGVYNFMTSAKTREASFRYVGGLQYIPDLVEDKDIQHPAVASLSDPPEAVELKHLLTEPRDFYRRYKLPTAHCRKLVNIGGQGCLRRYEGNKDVCLDTEVIPPRGTCLVYSFGVADDITFEDSLVSLRNCLVHLYDPTILRHGWLLEPPDPKRVFHSEALAAEHKEGPSSISTHTVMETLDALLEKNGHRHATLHYLKLDIEGGEWKVLRHLVENGLLDNVVQLALELHSTDLKDLPRDSWLGVLQERYDVLHSLEEAGFRRVRVVDNEHYLCRVDFRGPQDRPEEGAESTEGNYTDGVAPRAGNALAQGNHSIQIQKMEHKLNSASGSKNKGSADNSFKMETSGSKLRDGHNRDDRSSSGHLPFVADTQKRNHEVNGEVVDTTILGDVHFDDAKYQYIHSTINSGDDTIDTIKDQTVISLVNTVAHPTGDAKNQTVHSTITSGGDQGHDVKDQSVITSVNTLAPPTGDVKGPFVQSTIHHGDVQRADPSGDLNHLASRLKGVPSGVAVKAGEIFDTEEEWLEFERHFQQVCQEVLYVRVHKPSKFKGR